MKRALEAWPTVLGQTASNHGRKLIRPAQRHGRNDRFRRLPPNVIALVNSDEGLVTSPTAGAQPEQRELAFMPVIAKPPAQVLDHAAEL